MFLCMLLCVHARREYTAVLSVSKPTGITILAILELLSSVLMIIGVAAFSLIFEGTEFAIIGGVMLGIVLFIGLLSLLVGYGFWTGKGWA
jgi:hypothetical protein